MTGEQPQDYGDGYDRPASQAFAEEAFADAHAEIRRLKAEKVDRPPHYTSHPARIECIQVTEHLNFCLGNAIKYIWRADLKGNAVQDLQKARWYIDREIARRKAGDKINGN